jgi:UDP-glucuronate 4-epimerase
VLFYHKKNQIFFVLLVFGFFVIIVAEIKDFSSQGIWMSAIVVTGSAGFIGFHVSQALLRQGYKVVGIDNLNDYYSTTLKQDRLDTLRKGKLGESEFFFYQNDITDKSSLDAIFERHKPSCVINLAAQAGVRYSIEAPQAYIDTNVTGFQNILDACRNNSVEHLLYASSSSVYGNAKEMPFSSAQPVDHPVSMYAATKRMNELMAHVYSDMYGMKTTGLRFFTVYGPWGRPDMAPMKFAKAIMAGEPIDVYNNGDHWRDFTYIDDIVAGICGLINSPTSASDKKSPDRAISNFGIYNIGAKKPINLLAFIETLEDKLEKKAVMNMKPMQPGDVHTTYADVEPLSSLTGYTPKVDLTEGIGQFISWYRSYYNEN